MLFSKGIAAISKPRCGSTSVRRMLDPFVNSETGDIAVNMAGEQPPFHPHITAPYLQELLREKEHNSTLAYFITIRHPVEMLASYFKFFQPDRQSRYNFSPGWDGQSGMTFEEWVLFGKVGMNPNWKRLAPIHISMDNLSPLSLEAHAFHTNGSQVVKHVFMLEEPEKIRSWLSEKLQHDVGLQHVNQSKGVEASNLGHEALEKVKTMMPLESQLYNL